MATSSNLNATDSGEPCSHRLVAIALIASFATLSIAAVYPSGKPADDSMSLSFTTTYTWIAAQSFALSLPGLILGMIVGRVMPRMGAILGAGLILVVPVIVLCDVLTFTWIAERFLSDTMRRIVTTLLPVLKLHVTTAAVVEAIITAIAVLVFMVAAWWIAGIIGRRWRSQKESVQPFVALVILSLVALIASFSAIRNLRRTVSEMANSSTRHPFCVFHIVGYRGVGVSVPKDERGVLAQLRGLQSVTAVHRRDENQAAVRILQETQNASSTQPRPSRVIIVVIECLRPEVIDPEIMPNLYAFAEKSIVCTRNFSSGNATCHSMFSLVNGLESIWFRRPVSKQPIMNRLLHEAGFELGFFGGQTDWHEYNMEGFVGPQHFDEFEIEEPDLPDSDIRAVERTVRFIDHGGWITSGVDGKDSARAAITYMYATHSAHRYSDAKDRVFQPVASANSMIGRSPEKRDQFYNGYKNSLRTMDGMIAPLLRDDCVVLVMGDHGEPFLDDGTIVHGTRLSRFQNMTPAVIYYPGVEPRKIDLPTCHSDLLPTLLSILSIPVTDPAVFDGIDLLTVSEDTLADRSFVTRNFMDSTHLLVGPWTFDARQPFGYRVAFNIRDWQSSYLNPIDECGYQWDAVTDDHGSERFRRWVIDRFGPESFDEFTSSRDLFERFFKSPDDETRISALKIASCVPDPDEHLYGLIAAAAQDPNPEIRAFAKDLVIRVNRIQGSNP
jgi:membrane-anchored protein YejM (alkaline phosphatase superfamily)